MTDLEKKVFREVFIEKYVKIPTEEERNKIINFYSDFDVHISISAKYKQDVGKMAYIRTKDGLTAYGLFGMISTTYNFDDLKEEYEKKLRRYKMKKLEKIAFRNNTTTLVYDNFKVVRAKASNKDEAIRETGLLVALLKALKVKDYNTIIANAWDTDNELTRHFYLYGVIQQLYVDKELLSRNQFNKLFEAVGDKKPNVNIGGEIIELEYK